MRTGRRAVQDAREHLTGDVPVSNTAVMATLCLVGWSVLVLLIQPPAAPLLWVAGAPVVVAVVWLFSGPRYVWLSGDRVGVQERGRRQEMALSDVVGVHRRWIPYKGWDLVLVGRQRTLRIVNLEPETEALRHEIGRRLPEPELQVRDMDARVLLGLATNGGARPSR